MSDEIWFNLFKARENEIGIIYENNTLVVEEDFTFKAGVPYKLTLSKKTADSGKQYISIRAIVNQWAIENNEKFSHLKGVTDSIKEQKEDTKQLPDDEIDF